MDSQHYKYMYGVMSLNTLKYSRNETRRLPTRQNWLAYLQCGLPLIWAHFDDGRCRSRSAWRDRCRWRHASPQTILTARFAHLQQTGHIMKIRKYQHVRDQPSGRESDHCIGDVMLKQVSTTTRLCSDLHQWRLKIWAVISHIYKS